MLSTHDAEPSDSPAVVGLTQVGFDAFHLPFAAYLLPSDLVAGEHVFLADIIEDIVSARWNQGANCRLKSCIALWNGTDFEMDFDPEMDAAICVG